MARLIADERAEVIAFLERHYRAHRECEDCWYSCPKSADYCRDDGETECDCGKDEADALIGRLYLREPKLTPRIKQRAEELSRQRSSGENPGRPILGLRREEP